MSQHTRATDVLIAGAGLIGLCSAHALAERGLTVRLLDAGEIGRQASWAGAGILWPIYPWRYPEPVQALAQAGRRLYPPLCAALRSTTGIDPEYRHTGLLLLDAEERHAAQQWCTANNEPLQALDAGQAVAHQPGLRAGQGALYLPQVAQVRNPRLCQALAAACRRQGVIIETRTEATGIRRRAGVFQGVETSRGTYTAGIGVIAAGAWSSRLVAALDVEPVKGQMLLFKTPPDWLRQIVLRKGVYVVPRADGHVLVGSTVEHSGFDTTTDVDTRQALLAEAADSLPALAQYPLVAHWAGLRPATPDGVPVIGPISGCRGLYANVGQYRNGVLMAPSSAQRLLECLAGE